MSEHELVSKIRKIKTRYPSDRSAVLPALIAAQRYYGWLSPTALETVAEALDIHKSQIRGVATFHTMFKNKQSGRHFIQLCSNIACMLFGAETLLEILKESYGLVDGGTTEDGRFSLAIMECIGACDTPPAMLVNDDFYTNLTRESIIEILENYK